LHAHQSLLAAPSQQFPCKAPFDTAPVMLVLPLVSPFLLARPLCMSTEALHVCVFGSNTPFHHCVHAHQPLAPHSALRVCDAGDGQLQPNANAWVADVSPA
jgi:hypothetical protein